MQNMIPDTDFSGKELLLRDRVVKTPNGIHKLKMKCVGTQKKVAMKALQNKLT